MTVLLPLGYAFGYSGTIVGENTFSKLAGSFSLFLGSSGSPRLEEAEGVGFMTSFYG